MRAPVAYYSGSPRGGTDTGRTYPRSFKDSDNDGYDISDYRAIMSQMGSMADFDGMLQGFSRVCANAGMR